MALSLVILMGFIYNESGKTWNWGMADAGKYAPRTLCGAGGHNSLCDPGA